MNRFYVSIIAALLAIPTPAMADPISVAILSVLGTQTATALAISAVTFALTTAATIGVSALSRALKGDQRARSAGTVIESTRAGGTNSRSILVGLYCTAGSLACPPMSHGQDGDTPNAFLTHVVIVSDYPVDGLDGIIVNGEYVTYGGVAGEYGIPLGGKYAGKGWIKFYDGRQTVADSYLTSRYGSYIRPWLSSHIGYGTAYAILTWKYDPELFKGEPNFKFVVRGARLYDPRHDTTAGGSGSQRWGDPSTWAFTSNNAVIVYNILRGITLYDGSRWGGECLTDDLPLANWVAAMNKCDAASPLLGGGTEPQYQCGYEILVAEMEPAVVIEEFVKSCSGAITEVGGIYKMRAGGPALPTVFVTDNDFLVSQPSDYDPFPALNATHNGIFATFPHPNEEWKPHDAPALVDVTYIAEDDNRENFASVQLPAVPYPVQVQRLMKSWLEDDRRWRRHSASLGPYSFILEPMDTISWTSVHNGYVDKAFEITSTSTTLMSLITSADMREVDPSDYDWTAAQQLPDPTVPGVWELPTVQAVPGWAVEPYAIKDALNGNRRPAIRASWTVGAASDATALKIQVRMKATQVAVADITVSRVDDGQTIIVEGILPGQIYEVRGRYQADRPTEWSSWLTVTTDTILFGPADVSGLAQLNIDTATALGAISDIENEIDTMLTDINTIEGEVSTLNSTVSTQGVTISDHTSAISTTNTNLANVTTRLNASAPNLLPYGDFQNGLTGWTPSGTWVSDIGNRYWGNVVYIYVSGGNHYLESATFPADVGQTFTISADIDRLGVGTGGTIAARIVWLNGATVHSTGPVAIKVDGGFGNNDDNRVRATGVVPAGVDGYLVQLISEGATGGGVFFRRVKVNYGPYTPYSVEASVTRVATAYSTLSGQYASLSDTVGIQGVTISDHTSAISTTNGNVTTLFGRRAIDVDVDGYSIGWEMNNNGSTGSLKFRTDLFELSSPSGTGERLTIINGAIRVYDSSNNLRVALGVGI